MLYIKNRSTFEITAQFLSLVPLVLDEPFLAQ